MKPYSADILSYPPGVEPYEPTPQNLNLLPYDHAMARLAEQYSNGSGKLTGAEVQALSEVYAHAQKSSALEQLSYIDEQIAATDSPDESLLQVRQTLLGEQKMQTDVFSALVAMSAAQAFQIARGSLSKTIRYASHYGELEDRMQDALIGLIKAINRHRPEVASWRIGGFYTYRAILNSIQDNLESEDNREMLGPRTTHEAQQAIGSLQKEHGIADLATIAYEGDYRNEERRNILNLHNLHVAAHHVLLEDIQFPLAAVEETWDSNDEPPILRPEEILADQNDSLSCFMEKLNAGEIVEAVQAALNVLKKPEDRQILRLRYGLDGNPPLSVVQLGELLGVPAHQARQLEANALKELRIILTPKKEFLTTDVRDQPGRTTDLSVSALKTMRASIGPPLPGAQKK